MSSLNKVYRKALYASRRWFFDPSFPSITDQIEKEFLGSDYGGKFYAPDDSLLGSIIISAGCGEDISFDTELASKWDAKVIFIDPTPRSIEHVKGVIAASGSPRKRSWSSDGRQSIDSYELADISRDQFVLIEAALWNENGEIEIFPPLNPEHVSYSISDLQNVSAFGRRGIRVKSTTIAAVLAEFSINDIPLLKLDIEGAEIEVLEDMLNQGIFPLQILVEFDELLYPSKSGSQRITRVLQSLKQNGYTCYARNNADLSFIRKVS